MPFIGNTPDVNFTSFAKQDLTGVTGSPVKRGFTLTHAVANANEIEVFVNNVRQEPTEAYTVSGTGLTMTGDVETSDDFYIIYLGKAIQTTVPPDGSVSTAKIASSAVDLTSKVTGVLPVANGGTGLSNFTASTMTLATTLATTSGTSVEFTGIPSGVKRISVMFRGVSSSGSDVGLLVQVGTSSGFKTSGYASTTHWGTGGTSDHTGFAMYGIANANILSGIMTIAHMGSNVFVASHSGKYNTSNGMFGGGDVDLGGTVDRVAIKTISGGAFDGGSVNIMYES